MSNCSWHVMPSSSGSLCFVTEGAVAGPAAALARLPAAAAGAGAPAPRSASGCVREDAGGEHQLLSFSSGTSSDTVFLSVCFFLTAVVWPGYGDSSVPPPCSPPRCRQLYTWSLLQENGQITPPGPCEGRWASRTPGAMVPVCRSPCAVLTWAGAERGGGRSWSEPRWQVWLRGPGGPGGGRGPGHRPWGCGASWASRAVPARS